MPVVTFDRRALCRVIGRDVPIDVLAARMPMLGGDLDGIAGDAITIEWFPNRPDLLTLEGTARAMRAFLDVKPGLSTYPVRTARTELRVDPAVREVRPFAALAFVRDVPIDEAYVGVLVEAQEKLTFSPGRKRRKVAIGIHDARGLEGPFTYTLAGPADPPFVPLGGAAPLTPQRILAEHPKGRAYAHLLPAGKFPVFLDGHRQVVSMPPIINAERTAVTPRTKDLLLDVTGTDLKAVRQTMALLATSLAERGGAIEAVTVHDASGTWTSPDLRPSEHILHTDDVAALLGLSWTGEHTAVCLRRMGHEATAYDNKVHVKVATWRHDILHPVDLLEDVGIGHGFEHFPGTMPRFVTFGAALPHQGLEETLRTLSVGHGAHEAKTLTLSDARQQWTNWGLPEGDAVRLLNPVMEEQTLLRVALLPSLLSVLAANRHRNLPQSLFEVGYAVQPEGEHHPNRLHFAFAQLAASSGFSAAKGLAESLVRDARLPLELASGQAAGFIPGRAGLFLHAGKRVGHFGELHPDTIVAFGLGAPCIGIELDLSDLR